jgi:hypothetical protein
MDTTNIVLAVVTALALVGGVLVARRGSAADLVAAATGLVDPLRQRITDLEARVHELEPLVPRVQALELWGRYLSGEVTRLGGVPIPFDEFLWKVTHGDDPLPN